jgi:hypothetical protein
LWGALIRHRLLKIAQFLPIARSYLVVAESNELGFIPSATSVTSRMRIADIPPSSYVPLGHYRRQIIDGRAREDSGDFGGQPVARPDQALSRK